MISVGEGIPRDEGTHQCVRKFRERDPRGYSLARSTSLRILLTALPNVSRPLRLPTCLFIHAPEKMASASE